MVKWIAATAVFAALCLPAAPVLSEFYKYRDENGVLRFTDDLSMVPPDQRPKVDTYEEVQTTAPAPAPSPGVSDEDSASAGDAGKEKPTRIEDISDIQAARARLEQTRKQLEQERSELDRMKRALQQERARVETEEDARAYDEKVQELNERIAEYEERRAEFTQEAEDLNAARTQ